MEGGRKSRRVPTRFARHRSARRAAAWLACAAAMAPAAPRADESHYHDYPVGDRALGLGGAFTALADDASAAYHNPAGLAEVPSSSFSLSGALYGRSKETLEADFPVFVEGGDGGFREERVRGTSRDSGFVTAPTMAAWMLRVREGAPDGTGRVQLAVSAVTPDKTVRHQALIVRHDGTGSAPRRFSSTPARGQGQALSSGACERIHDPCRGDRG